MISNALAGVLRRHDIHYGWVVVAVTFLTMLVTAGAVGAPGVFIEPLEKEFGWRRDEVSAALAVRFALFGLMGPFAAAFMNRFGVRRVVLAALSLIAAALTASLDFTIVGLTIFALFYGLDWIATVPPTVKLTAERFGDGKANIVFGWIFAGHQLGAASAAYGAGLSRTVYDTYLPAFFVAGVLCILAALAFAALRNSEGPRRAPLAA